MVKFVKIKFVKPMATLALLSAAGIISAVSLTGCAGFGVYKIDIQQGNLVTQDQVAKVKTGMSRVEVRNTLGTPLLQDVFHQDRWDYYFSDDRSTKYGPFGREKERFQVTVVFQGDKVTRVDGVASAVEILTGGGDRRKTPDARAPGAPSPPPKS